MSVSDPAIPSTPPAASTAEAVLGPKGRTLASRLRAAWPEALVEVRDDSHGHRGRAGTESHFAVAVVTPAFAGLSALARHRKVLGAIGDLRALAIHAVAIEARAPDPGSAEESRASPPAPPPCRGGDGPHGAT